MMRHFLILTSEDVSQLLSMKEAIDVIRAFIASGKANTRVSNPARMVIDLEPEQHAIYQFRSGYLSTAGRIGIRIANLKDNNTRQVLLMDARDAACLALISETHTFKLRIAATVANIINKLVRGDRCSLALIGTGDVGRAIAEGINELGMIRCVCIYDKIEASLDAFESKIRGHTDFQVLRAKSVREAVESADIIITVTTANEPLVEAAWIKKGSLVISLGIGQELDPNVILNADKVIVDDIELCKSVGDIAALIRLGLYRENKIHCNLYELFQGLKTGREGGDENIVVVSQGMIGGDISLINFVYEKALETGKGYRLLT